MHLSIEKLKLKPELLLIDGNKFHDYKDIPHRCIIKGDSKFASIAAASILAKTYRDKLMQKLHQEFPQYGGQYSALRDDLVHSRGRLNYVQKKLNEHKLTAEENLEHKFIVNAAGPALKNSYPIRWLIVVATAFSTVLFMVLIIALKEQIKSIKQS